MSEKTVAQKLLIRENYKVLLINAPTGYDLILGELPPGVTVLDEPTGAVDPIQLFAATREELEQQLEKLKHILAPKGLLWVTYPKGSSKIKTDVNRDSIREYARSIGLEAVAMVSIDDIWSALRLKIA